MKKQIVIGLLLLISTPAYSFRPFILHTGRNKIKVIEVYTSEACGKCEGSEKWLANLRSNKGLFKKFIAVSFHLPFASQVESVQPLEPTGTADPTSTAVPPTPIEAPWIDIFAKPDFSSRKKDSVGLPSFLINGEDWQWDENAKLPENLIDKAEEVGDLSVARNRLKEFEVTFSPKEKLSDVAVNVALLGSGISRQITAGENANKTLNENFVVLEFVTKSLHKSGNVFSGHVKLNLAKNNDVKTFSAVFWTTKEEDGTKPIQAPIQATGGDLKLE